MAIEGLAIIGESINDSVPSTNKLFEAGDIEGIKALAQMQDERGATYIDVNVGLRGPAFMAELIKTVQEVTAKPLSIDTPDPEMAAAGLEAYDAERAGGEMPILNSIAMKRIEMLELYKIQPFMPILLVSEREESGESKPNKTGAETYETAKAMLKAVRDSGHGIANEHCIFDPGIPPIGSDTEGLTKMVLDSMQLIHDDPDFKGVHMSVGLSNFTVMLPPKRADGSPVKSPLESAFLTKAMPRGLDMVIGSVKRKYEVLADDHPAMQCLEDVLKLEAYDCVMRVLEFYS